MQTNAVLRVALYSSLARRLAHLAFMTSKKNESEQPQFE